MEEIAEFVKKVRDVLEYSLTLGGTKITLLGLIEIVLVIIASLIVSRVLRRILKRRILPRFKLAEGAQFAILRLIHYVLVVIGLFLAINLVGIQMTSFLGKYGLNLGGTRITLLGLVVIVLVLIAFFIVSRVLRGILKWRILPRFKLAEGAQFVILRLIHYVLVVIGLFLAINLVGIQMTSLAVIFGLLGVGIAFGLQNITSNFVSGLILLFERPVSVGDYIEVGGAMGRVQSINMRSTTVITRDNITLIVPNSSFIADTVTNWSVGDPKIRINVPVGVAYGSDTELVKKLLLEVADNHPDVLKDPKPDVLFREFADSSLNFDLRIWILNPMGRFKTISDINYAVDAAFREHNITIPFPQRDVHFYQEA